MVALSDHLRTIRDQEALASDKNNKTAQEGYFVSKV
jgi:hypothetical protein